MDYDEKQLTDVAIARFCDYLNLWGDAELKRSEGASSDFRYTPEVFTDDPSRDFYGSVKVLGKLEVPEYEQLILVIQASDGDEGGPSLLTCYFQEPYEVHLRRQGKEAFEEEKEWQLVAMVQEFDTMHVMAISSGELQGPGGITTK